MFAKTRNRYNILVNVAQPEVTRWQAFLLGWWMWTAIFVGLVDVDTNFCRVGGCGQQFLLGWWMWTATYVGLVDVDSIHFYWAGGCGQQTFLLGCWMWTANISIGLVDVDNNFCWAGGCGQQPFLLGWWMWTAINVGLVVEDSRHLHSAGITVCLAGYYSERRRRRNSSWLLWAVPHWVDHPAYLLRSTNDFARK